MTSKQLSLISSEGEEKSASWYLEIGRRNLLRVLAGGVIGPRHVISRHRSGDFFSLYESSVPLFKYGLNPSDLELLSAAQDKTDIQILVEIGDKHAEKYLPTEFSASTDTEMMLLPTVMSTNAISAIHFRSDEERTEFVVREFENVPIDKFELCVSPELFEHNREISLNTQGDLSTEREPDSSDSLKECARLADRLVGGITLLAHVLPGESTWATAFSQFLDEISCCPPKPGFIQKFNRKLIDSLGAQIGAQGNRIDESLILSALRVILESSIDDGWDAEENLTLIISKISRDDALDEHNELTKWQDFCLRVIRNEIDIPKSVFADERDVMRRAIFLLLLRPEPEEVVLSMESGLRAGASVRALAALFSGMRIGFEGLPNIYKSNRSCYEGLSELKSWLINALWEGSDTTKDQPVTKPEVSLVRESYDLAGVFGCAKVIVNGFEIAEVLLQPPLALREVWNKAESVGFHIKYDQEHEKLVIPYKDGKNSVCEVYVSELADQKDNRLVRLWTCCLDVSTPSNRKKLTKTKALDLLEYHSRSSTHARFALDEKLGAIIAAVDQVAATIQKEELRRHLESIIELYNWFSTRN